MKSLVLLVLVIVVPLVVGLSEGEITAISDLTKEWPFLAHLSPAWTSNASEACNQPVFSGITCSDGPDKHVTSLTIYDRESEDLSVPDSIGDLIWLECLSLDLDGLSSGIPDSIGNLRNLLVFKLSLKKTLNDSLPTTIGNWFRLRTLELTLFDYLGPFPDGIKKMTSLRRLWLTGDFDRVSFYGNIPPWVCELDTLIEFDLHHSALSGLDICRDRLPNLEKLTMTSVPNMSVSFESLVSGRKNLTWLSIYDSPIFGSATFPDQTKLKLIEIKATRMTGTIDDSLWQNRGLTSLSLTDTPIQGTLSPQIKNLADLRILNMRGTLLSGPIPDEIGLLNFLMQLDLQGSKFGGQLPRSLFESKILTTLNLDGNKFNGTIPDTLPQCESLQVFSANSNRLRGSIPEVSASCAELHLSNNLLSGPIPDSVLRNCMTIVLFGNRLTGTLSSALYFNSFLQVISLSNNQLTGPLPILPNLRTSFFLKLSHNNFSGTIPKEYQTVKFASLILNDNNLNDSISDLLANALTPSLDLRSNRLHGTIPTVISGQISSLLVSNNFITGTIPPLPESLKIFVAANNHLYGSLDAVFAALAQRKAPVDTLDLSHNRLEGTIAKSAFACCSFLSLASNRLSGSITSTDIALQLSSLDLSNNRLTGEFPFTSLGGSLSSLILSNNSFSGRVGSSAIAIKLTVLDISNNQFEFDASEIFSHAYLSFLLAGHNRIYGELSLREMNSLISADFDNNLISKADFQSISTLSLNRNLNSLSIANNSIHYQGDVYEKLLETNKIAVTSLVAPSAVYPGVECPRLGFGNALTTYFVYDESIFSYQQCRCGSGFYGIPPDHCFKCDTLGETSSSTCGGYSIGVAKHFFLFQGATSLQIESCLAEPWMNSGYSNCAGIQVEFNSAGAQVFNPHQNQHLHVADTNSIFPSSSQLSQQCAIGSSGRLCSKCDCEVESATCYFPGPGQVCKKCAKVYSPSVAFPVTATLVSIVTIILSIVFYLVIESKRRLKDTKWEDLSIISRIVHRLIHLSSIGQITIMFTFLQILIEVTQWDAYVISSWTKLLNGNGESLGLRCFFPFLSSPIASLTFRLFLPFFVIAIVFISTGLAVLVGLQIERSRKLKHDPPLEDMFDQSSINDLSELLSPVGKKTTKLTVPYPAMGLATSVSISILKFFYFGTTMAAFEYLFAIRQMGTGTLYVLSVPWMSYDDAHILQQISIPFILVYLLVIPLFFAVFSWKLRHKIFSPSLRVYFGSLFENYEIGYHWWEMVNILKKLAVAILLRWLSPGNGLQPFFTSFIIGSIGIVTMRFLPWKIRYENFFEGIGALLLMMSLASSRLANLAYSRYALIFILIFDMIYVIACLAVIAYRVIRDKTSYEIEWNARFLSHTEASVHSYEEPLHNSEQQSETDEGDWALGENLQ